MAEPQMTPCAPAASAHTDVLGPAIPKPKMGGGRQPFDGRPRQTCGVEPPPRACR